MKRILTAAIAAAVAFGREAPAPEETITVCMQRGHQILVARQAQYLASRMYLRVGIRLEWVWASHGECRTNQIFIRITEGESKDFKPEALAYALPFEGTQIRIFYDRVQNAVSSRASLPTLLAHVMAHEIAHLLQGTDGHSTGIMKARWTRADYQRMFSRPLEFSAADVALMHRGMDLRRVRVAVR